MYTNMYIYVMYIVCIRRRYKNTGIVEKNTTPIKRKNGSVRLYRIKMQNPCTIVNQ